MDYKEYFKTLSALVDESVNTQRSEQHRQNAQHLAYKYKQAIQSKVNNSNYAAQDLKAFQQYVEQYGTCGIELAEF